MKLPNIISPSYRIGCREAKLVEMGTTGKISQKDTKRMQLSSFLKLTPAYRDYVWGGDRLRPGHYPTAEAWVVWEGDVIESGSLAGKTIGEAAQEYGEALLGSKTSTRTGTRFPILIKLLDCAEWLSLQVHP